MTESEKASRITEYLRLHGDDLSFTDAFWKRCEPHPSELERYTLCVRTILLSDEGKSMAEISLMAGFNQQTVRSWIKFEHEPKLAHYLSLYLQLEKPKCDWVWLSVNNASGHAVPLGPTIQVPKAISKWDDVAVGLAQLEPLENLARGLSREYLFSFLLGMIIGDAARSSSKTRHHHLGLG